jgi:hypothetical protein
MSIYVELFIRAPLDAIWSHTQVPALHEQWDLRFSAIEYLPRAEGHSQRFRFTTRLGFGLEVSGEGETVGERRLPDGTAASALEFASDAPLSIIREGSGYWKYIPADEGVRFLTRYDYRTRFGAVGAAIDRWIFRPIIGWATAWSFDRLRLWLEAGINPRLAWRHTLIHFVSRVTLAAVFAYQGLVPKLLVHHGDEIAMLRAAGVPLPLIGNALVLLGTLELAMGAALLYAWCRPWPAWACLFAMPVATAVVATQTPSFFAAAFNPFSLNLSVAALAAVDLLVLGGVPSATRCRRKPCTEKP